VNDRLKRAKATLVDMHIRSKEKKQSELQKSVDEHDSQIKKTKSDIERLKGLAQEKKEKTAALSQEIEEKGEEEQIKLNREIEKTRVEIATDKNRIGMSDSEITKMRERKGRLENDSADIQNKIVHLEESKIELLKKKESVGTEKGKVDAEIKRLRDKSQVENISELEADIQKVEKDAEKMQEEVQKLVSNSLIISPS